MNAAFSSEGVLTGIEGAGVDYVGLGLGRGD